MFGFGKKKNNSPVMQPVITQPTPQVANPEILPPKIARDSYTGGKVFIVDTEVLDEVDAQKIIHEIIMFYKEKREKRHLLSKQKVV